MTPQNGLALLIRLFAAYMSIQALMNLWFSVAIFIVDISGLYRGGPVNKPAVLLTSAAMCSAVVVAGMILIYFSQKVADLLLRGTSREGIVLQLNEEAVFRCGTWILGLIILTKAVPSIARHVFIQVFQDRMSVPFDFDFYFNVSLNIGIGLFLLLCSDLIYDTIQKVRFRRPINRTSDRS